MTIEQNKAIVRRFYKALEANDQDTLKELLSPDLVVYHGTLGPQTREAMLQGVNMWNAAFESHFPIEELIAEGDKVAVRIADRIIHNRGDFQGIPPSGKQVETRSVTFERIKDGKIVERWVISDWMNLMHELGLIPERGTAE